jgi:uncharacterized protein YegL
MTTAISPSFLCPITHNIMTNPYIDHEGNTYEYSAICEWLTRNNTSPITRSYLTINNLAPNRSLLEAITEYNQGYVTNVSEVQNIVQTNVNTFNLEDVIVNMNLNKFKFNNDIYFKLDIKPIEGNNIPPVDIICVIDISGSMDSPAYIQQDGKQKDVGFTILDITKHALLTIIDSMNTNDKIAIITFSNDAEVLTPLVNITNTNKGYIKTLVSNLRTKGATNMWAGLNLALQQISEDNNSLKNIMFLTDGIPTTHMLPPRGLINTLERKIDQIKEKNLVSPNIYTYGFGQSLDTDVLVNIAKIGNGNFSYIPDSGFVGTIFMHSLAYIKTQIANNLYIDLSYLSENIKNKIEFIGYKLENDKIKLSSMHYGLNKKLVFKINESDLNLINDNIICISLIYNTISNENRICQKGFDKNILINYDNNLLFRELTRLELINLLDNNDYDKIKTDINNFKIKYCNINNDIMQDFNDQIILAIDKNYYNKWGKNYIKSFISAHYNERCNNFKDTSVQNYGGNLFNKIKDEIDDIFTNLPAPAPSNSYNDQYVDNSKSYNRQQTFAQSFNNCNNGCFHESSIVLMDNNNTKLIKDISKGDYVIGKNNCKSKVVCVIKYKCCNNKNDMVKINNKLIITPFHPILENNEWVFPTSLGKITEYDCEYVYNLVLDTNHTVNIDSTICVTLGHNISENFVVSHNYFGTNKVINDLEKFETYNDGIVVLDKNNFVRCPNTNRVIKIQ